MMDLETAYSKLLIAKNDLKTAEAECEHALFELRKKAQTGIKNGQAKVYGQFVFARNEEGTFEEYRLVR